MSEWFQETALSGSLILALPVALVAGLISFFSPCVIPLLPGYLSYATGLSGADLADARRSRMVTGAVLFVLGFSVVFVLLGSLTGAAGAWLFTHTRQLNVVLGVLTILLGVAFLGGIGFLQRDWRIHKVPAVGLAAAPLLGFLFGVGWSPCVGRRWPRSTCSRSTRPPPAGAPCSPPSSRSASACRSSRRPWPTAG